MSSTSLGTVPRTTRPPSSSCSSAMPFHPTQVRFDPHINNSPSPSPGISYSLPYVQADETTVAFNPNCRSVTGNDDAARLNLSFRHSWWLRRREATYEALLRVGTSPARVERFCNCGSVAWVLRTETEPYQYRLATNACRDRWCEACSRERRSVITRNVANLLDGKSLRLLTLTLKSSNSPLLVQINWLYKCFRRFRRNSDIKPAMLGGLFFLEITHNHRLSTWHPHLHVLFEGSFIPHEVAKQTWFSVTGDSFIVDLRSLHSSVAAASYVSKYATKAVSHTIWAVPSLLQECITAMHGKRTFGTFGTWKGLLLSKPPENNVAWVCVAPLDSLIVKARHGDPAAKAVLAYLTYGVPLISDDLIPVPEDTS